MSSTSDSKIQQLNSKVDYLRASNADGVCVIEGTASWCPQCKAIAPEVEKMANEYADKGARFYQFDVDKCPDIAQELGVRVMPTFTIFKDGDIQEGVSGARAKELREKVEGNL
jgi:thioredoxin 1